VLGGVDFRGSVNFELLCWFWAFLLFWAFLSSSLLFCLTLPLFVSFAGFYSFPSSRWPSWTFLGFFGSSTCASWGLRFEFQTLCFCYQWTHQGRYWETKWSISWFDCDESLTWWGLNSNPRQFSFVFLLSLFYLENRFCLSRGAQVAGAAWRATTWTVAGVGDLVQRTRDGHTGRVLDGQAVQRSGDVVCGLHRARGDEERRFVGWASKSRSTVYEWFGLKTTRTVFAGLASKPTAIVFSSLTSKLVAMVSPDLASKSVVGFLVEPQN
jgi:hypothetical protein